MQAKGIRQFMERLDGDQEYQVTIEPWHRKRTGKQNNLLHGVVLPQVALHVFNTRDPWAIESVKEDFKEVIHDSKNKFNKKIEKKGVKFDEHTSR